MNVPLLIALALAAWAILIMLMLALCWAASNADDRAASLSSQAEWCRRLDLLPQRGAADATLGGGRVLAFQRAPTEAAPSRKPARLPA